MNDFEKISSKLQQNDDGIWYSSNQNDISYPEEGNNACFAVEESSFWFKHRNNCINSIVKIFPPHENTIFDIGGGNGFVSLGLEDNGVNSVLVEPGIHGIANAKNRGIKNLICSTTEQAEFRPNSIPAVGLFDVVEHIENDKEFLQSIFNLLQNNGRVYITVPAYSFLWSQDDISAGHFKRYTRNQLETLLKKSGFYIEYSSYFFKFLPLPIYCFKSLPYLLGLTKNNTTLSKDHEIKEGLVKKILNYLLNSELKKINKKSTMNFGGSCLIVAKAMK